MACKSQQKDFFLCLIYSFSELQSFALIDLSLYSFDGKSFFNYLQNFVSGTRKLLNLGKNVSPVSFQYEQC